MHFRPKLALACMAAAVSVHALAADAVHPEGAGKLDTVAPRLASFSTTPPADLAAPLAQLVLRVQADDDLSGVNWLMFALRGPHGQQIWIGGDIDVPTRRLGLRVAADVRADMEPGTWTVDWSSVSDAAGNTISYEQSELSLIGSTQIELTSTREDLVDIEAPSITEGILLTSTLSASGVLKGTPFAPIAKADFKVRDTGSGIQSVFADWCLANESFCFSTEAHDQVRCVLKATEHSGGSIAGMPPGIYRLRDLIVFDQAGNRAFYQGADFGGGTDFSTLMPGGHAITITP